MKNKKAIISIFIYIGILAIAVVAFFLVTNYQKNNSYETVLMTTSEVTGSRTAQVPVNDSFFQKYVKTDKVSKDTITSMKESGSTPITSKADISGKYTIGYIPAGVILTKEMFETNQVSEDGLNSIKLEYEQRAYIVLNAKTENAPANGFKKGIQVSIQNIEGIVSTNVNGVEEKNYGTICNKAEIYNIFYDENKNVKNVGIICEAKDSRKLLTLQDLGTTFRFVEGSLPLSSWTENDIVNEYNIKNMKNDEIFFCQSANDTIDWQKAETLVNAEFNEKEFGNVPEIQVSKTENVTIAIRGSYESSQIVLSKYYLNYYTLKGNPSGSDNLTEGYYEIRISTPDGYKLYHFIIEDEAKKDEYKEEAIDDMFNIVLKADGQLNYFSSSICFTKSYYEKCIPLKTHDYIKQISLNKILNDEGESINLDTFLISKSLGSFNGKKIENIYLLKDKNEEGTVEYYCPIFFRGILGSTHKPYSDISNADKATLLKEENKWQEGELINLSKFNALANHYASCSEIAKGKFSSMKDYYSEFVKNEFTEGIKQAYLVLEDGTDLEIRLNFVIVEE